MALHLGSFPDAMKALTAGYGDDMAPGDIFVFNDPYSAGGMHLPDVYIVKPLFYGGELEGYAATLVHQIDMGGIAPGSTAVYATEIFQEGLRIPVLKMYEEGRPNETFFRLMHTNTRVPDKLAGDMRAQVAACNTAERAYGRLVEKHGSETFRAILADLHDYAEAVTRQEIAKLPDGQWSFTDWLDGLGDDPEPIPLTVTVTIDGSRMIVDWAGTSPEVPGAINCPSPFVKSAVQLIVKCIAGEEIPNFEGFARAIEIRLPEGTIVNPRPPAACAARAIVGWRALDVLLGAFAQIVPDRIPAAGEGGVTFPAISGMHRGRQFVLSETLAGSWGAMPDRDGSFGIPNPGGNLTNQPVEMIEALNPLEIECYGMVENSGGPGRYPRRAGLPAAIPGARAGRRADGHALGPSAIPALRAGRRLPRHAVVEHRQSGPGTAHRAGHADGGGPARRGRGLLPYRRRRGRAGRSAGARSGAGRERCRRGTHYCRITLRSGLRRGARRGRRGRCAGHRSRTGGAAQGAGKRRRRSARLSADVPGQPRVAGLPAGGRTADGLRGKGRGVGRCPES